MFFNRLKYKQYIFIMKAVRLIMLVTIILSITSFDGQANVPESNSKPIKAVLEFYPNYAGHLLGVARIGYNSPYADKYKESINPADLKYLSQHADLLKWDDGEEGVLSYFFLTFPGYVNPASKTHLGEYLTDLNSAIVKKSFDDFRLKYKFYIDELDLWNGFAENEQIFNYSEEVQALSKIWMNNYDSFRNDVWPDHEEYMARLAAAMNDKFEDWNLIKRWESITGLEFKAPFYRVVLSTGMENGPTGKTLGYDKDWYYYGGDPKEMIQDICQEAGFRILAGLCSDQYKQYNPTICFEVYKSLSSYLTDQIFADLGLSDKFKSHKLVNNNLYSIFDLLWKINPGMNIKDFYGVAVDTYSRTQNIIVSNQF